MPQARGDRSNAFPSSDELAYYKLYRDRVVNEDTLIYQRLMWFLSTQTILFVLWAAVLNDPSISHAVTIGICLFGLFMCLASFLGVWAAFSEIKHQADCYTKNNPNPHPSLPLIVGNPDHHMVGKLPPYLLILSVVGGWVAVWVFFGSK